MLNDLEDKLKKIPSTCKSYAHCKCERYTGRLDEKLEYSCICCYNLQTPDGKYPNRREEDADYMQLYKKDSVEFLAYFSRNTDHSKKKILRNLFKSDFVNEEVITWLEKNEIDILRETAFT